MVWRRGELLRDTALSLISGEDYVSALANQQKLQYN